MVTQAKITMVPEKEEVPEDLEDPEDRQADDK